MKRILITDDSPIMRRNLNTILTQAGYSVAAEAADGNEALQAYRRFRPDLVTMDITMPVMDGLETVKKIVAEDPTARIIVISAFDRRSMLFEAMENGAKQYLIKPITADKLLHAVRQVLEETSDPGGIPHDAAERSSASAVSPDEPYFSVENRDGRFFITFRDPARDGPYTDLQTAVQGLLYVKPLDIAFRFGQAESCHPALAAAVENLIRSIRGAGGQAAVSAGRESLAAALRQAFSVPIAPEGRTR